MLKKRSSCSLVRFLLIDRLLHGIACERLLQLAHVSSGLHGREVPVVAVVDDDPSGPRGSGPRRWSPFGRRRFHHCNRSRLALNGIDQLGRIAELVLRTERELVLATEVHLDTEVGVVAVRSITSVHTVHRDQADQAGILHRALQEHVVLASIQGDLSVAGHCGRCDHDGRWHAFRTFHFKHLTAEVVIDIGGLHDDLGHIGGERNAHDELRLFSSLEKSALVPFTVTLLSRLLSRTWPLTFTKASEVDTCATSPQAERFNNGNRRRVAFTVHLEHFMCDPRACFIDLLLVLLPIGGIAYHRFWAISRSLSAPSMSRFSSLHWARNSSTGTSFGFSTRILLRSFTAFWCWP